MYAQLENNLVSLTGWTATPNPVASSILAEQSTTFDWNATTAIYSTRIVGQSLQVTEDGTINSITVRGVGKGAAIDLVASVGTSADLTTPSASGTYSFDGSTTAGEITIDLDSGLAVTTGTTYYFSISAPAGTFGTGVTLQGSGTSTYANGQYYSTTAGYPMVANANYDLYFKVVE
jgi:hypothetical protein